MIRETLIYLFVGISSLVMISYLPHMFLDGLVEDELKVKIQIGVTIAWAIGLFFLGMDIVKKRKGLK